MTEPTQEQIKELWEWCGLKLYSENIQLSSGLWWPDLWECPEGGVSFTPDLDLNNLFKYAVPKLEFVRLQWQPYIKHHSVLVTIRTLAGIPNKNVVGGLEIKEGGNDPALALFWAIWGIIKSQPLTAKAASLSLPDPRGEE